MQKQTDKKRTETPFELEDCLVHSQSLQLSTEELCTEDTVLYFSSDTTILRLFFLRSNLLVIFSLSLLFLLLKISLILWTMPFHPIF